MIARTFRVEPLNAISRQLDEVMESFFTPDVAPEAGPFHRSAAVFPAINAWEDGEALYVEAELPGYKLEDVELSMEGRDLTIKGEREVSVPEGATGLHRERASGAFARSIRVVTPVDAERVTATLRDGVLLVTLPKAAAAKPRKIAVSAGV
jgi:HSP20 family protein